MARKIRAVALYFDKHRRCEVCGSDEGACVHHINHNRSSEEEKEFFTLCFKHHTGQYGVHLISEVEWIENCGLTEHPKWKERYERLVRRLATI